jgi:hypothetical protein
VSKVKIKTLYFLNFSLIVCALLVFFSFSQDLFENSIDSNLTLAQTAENKDKNPPNISDVEIKDVSATSSTIIWNTNELSDSLVNYGLDKNYGISREPHFDKTEHTIVLDDLLPNFTYYFRITSSDASGNQGISNDYSFVTAKDKEEIKGKGQTEQGLENETQTIEKTGGKAYKKEGQAEGLVEEPTEPVSEKYIENIVKEIQQITNEEQLKVIQSEIQKTAEAVVEPPNIILDLAEVEVGVDYAIIRWKTDKKANSMAALAQENAYNPNSANPYSWKLGEPNEFVLDHTVNVTGLKPATVYHFQVSSKSEIGLEGKSSDKTFKTKSILPEISNIGIRKVEETSATIAWVTNVPCSAIVEYTNLENNENKLSGNTNFVTVHNMQLKDLKFDTYYSFVIRVENEQGDKAASDPRTFLTTKDMVPPIIAKVSTESTLYPGSDNKVQTIINWETDEMSKCQLYFQKGLISNDKPENLPQELEESTKHVQVATNFQPATVYKFWVSCKDDVGNEGKSENYSLLTPSREESIIDIIIKNFQSAFGWVKKVGN